MTTRAVVASRLVPVVAKDLGGQRQRGSGGRRRAASGDRRIAERSAVRVGDAVQRVDHGSAAGG